MDTPFKLLKTYEFLHIAELDIIKLRNEGLDVYLADSNIVNLAPFYAQAVGGIKLFVNKEDFERAREIVSPENSNSHKLEKLFNDAEIKLSLRCPKCNSSNVFRERSLLSGLIFLILFFLPVSIRKNTGHCARCGHRWNLRQTER